MELFDSQNNDVAVLGNIVIRRPRNTEATTGVLREASVLPRVRSLLMLPVPDVQIVVVGEETLAVHSLLPGEPLESVETLSNQTKEHLAAQLGTFLKSLHEIDSVVLDTVELPFIDQRWWAKFLYEAEQLVFPKLGSTTAELLQSQVRSHIEQLPNLPCVLRHGDFGSGNILWDGKKDIAGIIDFGSIGWGDPGWDVAGVFACYGRTFTTQLSLTYPAVESLLERAVFYKRMFALMEAVFGVENADEEALEDGLAALRKVV